MSSDGSGIFTVAQPAESFHTLVNLDYIESDNAAEIDMGIRESIRGIGFSVLAIGLGLANIKARNLYKDLGFGNLTQYIRMLCDETKADKGHIFGWLRIGEAYIKHRSELEKVGFCDNDGATKLSYLNRALEKNKKQAVFDNIKNMSFREFKNFAKGQIAAGIAAESPVGKNWQIKVRGNNIYIDDKLAIILSNKIDERVYKYFKRVLDAACEALEKGGVIVPVLMRNRKEADRFEDALARFKAELGLK